MDRVFFKKSNQTGKETFFYFVLALMPILSLYEFIPLVNLGYSLVIITLFFKIVKNKINITINLNIAMLMGFLIGINLIVGANKYSDITNTLNNSIGMAVFTTIAIFICNPKILNIEKLYKACKIIGIFTTVFLLYQFIVYHAFEIVVSGNISFLSLNDIGFKSIEYGRPSSFFLEPAHYSLYITPIYAMSIIKREYIISFLFFLGLLLSGSTTAIVMIIIVPIIIIFRYEKNKKFKITLLIIVSTIAIQLIKQSFFANVLTKLSSDSMLSSSRIFGTLYVFDYFGLNEWLLGIGINRIPDFLGSYMNIMIRNYANAILFCIISFGLVGGVAFIIYLYSLYKKTHKNYKVMWIILVLYLSSDQILFNRNLLYLLIWQYATLKPKINKEKTNGFSKK